MEGFSLDIVCLGLGVNRTLTTLQGNGIYLWARPALNTFIIRMMTMMTTPTPRPSRKKGKECGPSPWWLIGMKAMTCPPYVVGHYISTQHPVCGLPSYQTRLIYSITVGHNTMLTLHLTDIHWTDHWKSHYYFTQLHCTEKWESIHTLLFSV